VGIVAEGKNPDSAGHNFRFAHHPERASRLTGTPSDARIASLKESATDVGCWFAVGSTTPTRLATKGFAAFPNDEWNDR